MMHSIIVNNHFQFPWFDEQKFDHKNRFQWLKASMPRGSFQIRRSGGGGGGALGPHIKFGGKIWGKIRPSSPNKRKNLGSSVTTRRKS